MEVRQCSKCGQAAAVCIRDWKHSRFGVDVGSSTRDFACQSCGHRFTLVPKLYIWVPAAFAVLLSVTICGGLLFGGWALFRAWPWWTNPIIVGAPPPPIRFRATEPTRRCHACGDSASCRRVTRRRVNAIPTGTTYDYACRRCHASFRLESPYGVAVNAFGTFFLLGLGALTVMAGIGVVFLLAGLAYAGFTVWGVVQHLRHPVVPDLA